MTPTKKSQRVAAGSAVVAMLCGAVVPAAAQSIAARVHGASGQVELRFAAREGVCGDGENIMRVRPSARIWTNEDGRWACQPGPVRVVMTVRSGTVEHLRTYVGTPRSTPHGLTDLGVVPAAEAADYFLDLATHADERVAADALTPVALADSVPVVPRLVAVAQDRERPNGVRKRALFWAGQVGEEQVLDPARALVHDRSEERGLREHAVFVLSQLPESTSVPALIALAQSHEESWITRRAMFWLGQKHDPRATAFIASILEHE